MPYPTNVSTPAYVQELSPTRQRQWRHIWNQVYANCMNGSDPDSQRCESKAFSTASGVVIRQKGKAKHSMSKAVTLPDAAEADSEYPLLFKKLSSEERKNLPSKAYAYTDPEGGKHLPIHDLAHLRNAISRLGQPKTLQQFLSAGAKKRLQARLQKKLGSAQHAYDQAIAHHLAVFNLGPDQDNGALVEAKREPQDVVLRKGLIFRSGDYPDKGFSLSPKELKDVARTFGKPVQIDSEHEKSIFDGRLGELVKVKASKDGTELHGVVAIPKWLDPILMGAGGKVSAAFDRGTKKLVGLALTINPRVSDAALMAAFSVDQAARGNLTVKELMKMAEKDQKTKAKVKASAFNDDHDDDDDDDDKGKGNGKNGSSNGKNGGGKDESFPQRMQRLRQQREGKGAKTKMKKKRAEHSSFVGYDRMVPQAGALGQSGGAKPNGFAGDRDDMHGMGTRMHGTRGGQAMFQQIHDVCATRGAVCRMEPEPATQVGPYGIVRYASKGEMDVIQGIHDTTLSHGASCTPSLYGQQDVGGAGGGWSWRWPGVENEGYHETVAGGITKPHFTKKAGSKAGMKTEKAFKQFMQSFDGLDPRYGSAPAGKPKATFTDGGRQRDEEVERLTAENRQMKMQHILDRAAVFADKMIAEGHATPIEREGIITVHSQLDHDDTFTAQATFSNGMSRVQAYEASILARPNNLLQGELLTTDVRQGLARLANMSQTPAPSNDAGPVSEERKRHLTSLDPVLKNAFEARTAARNGSGRHN